jgi:hypothetical protein
MPAAYMPAGHLDLDIATHCLPPAASLTGETMAELIFHQQPAGRSPVPIIKTET